MKYNLVTYQSDNKENPGFFATKPMRGARGRGDDYLLLNIFPSQESAYWQANLARVAHEAVRAYYKSPGSITNAMRAAVEQVNKLLRAQNSGLRLDKTPESATIMLGVLRDGVLYMGQAGHASALLVSGAGTQLFHDEEVEQRGLGLTDLFEMRYFRTDFFGADFVLLGLPMALKVFEREAPTPSSVIRLVNETDNLTSAFSLTKIGLGDGEVENRMLSLAMLLDEPAPIDEASPEQTQPDATVVEEEPIVPVEEVQSPIPAQMELPIDVTSTVGDAVHEVSKEKSDQPNEIIADVEPAFEEVVVDGLVEENPTEESLPEEEFSEDNDAKVDQSTVIIDVPRAFEEESQVEASEVFEPKVEVSGLEEKLEDMPEVPGEAQQIESSLPVGIEADEGASAVEDQEAADVEADEPLIQTEENQVDEALIIETVIKEPDAAALARQERLERLKQGALAGIARGAGWLRGVEEGAQVTAHRAEQKANAIGQEIPSLSPFSKWAIVILVPLLVVAIAVSIYFARGLNRQYIYFVNQARSEMQSAGELTDLGQQRQAWVQAVVWLNQAREFNQGDNVEIITLRNQAQAGLDAMDGVKRIVFHNAFGKTIYPDLDISHLVPSQQAVFALDKNSGRVLRFYKAGESYLPDNKFVCAPGTYGDVELGPIIDITDIPGSSPNNALVMGIDATGKVIYCSDSGKDQIVTQLRLPEGGIGSIDAIHFGNEGLYVLDATKSKIWVYRGLMDKFPNEPGSYLGSATVDLSKAVDMVVRREGLYLLYADGRMVFGDVPVYDGFGDSSNQEEKPYTIQGQFSQISGLPVADNRLYFLETSEPAIGRYSYRLVFHDVLKVSFGDQATPGGSVSALAVSSSQTAFLAYGGELFYAQLP